MTTAYLALGSNLGDRRANLRCGLAELVRDGAVRVVVASAVYETAPVGGPPQPDFLNMVVAVETALDPEALLDRCLAAEAVLGRVRRERWGPRVVDIDLLVHGDEVRDSGRLILPHPRMAGRAFVMAPLAEIAPHLKIGDTTAAALAARLGQEGVRRAGMLEEMSVAGRSGVKVRELSRGLVPERLFAGLCERPGAFLLDSARDAGGAGRYSFIGFDPFLVFREIEDGGVVVAERGRPDARPMGDPWELLRGCLRRFAAPAYPQFPFSGGAVGYFSYELCALFDGIKRRTSPDPGMPRVLLGFHDGVIVHDNTTARTWAVANPVHERSAEEILNWLTAAVEQAGNSAQAAGWVPASEPLPELSPEQYREKVSQVRDYIAAGDVYQINLTQRFTSTYTGGSYALYRRLRSASPAAFAAYLNCGDFEIMGSSPERFLKICGWQIETRPIKGTRPRGATPSEDARQIQELLASEKDRAELLMIVDLERNDLGRVCVPGSVRVSEMCALETHPTVHHLVATVQGRLRPGCDTLDAFRAAFPGGSITGAPKIRAMQIIDELEPCRRNVYTGALGWIGFDGDCDLNISIRTMIRRGDRVDYHTGGGVVWDSDPDAEHAEAIVKGRAMREALVGGPRDGAPPGIGPWIMHGDELVPASEARVSPLADGFMFAHGLFETMRAIDSRPAFLSRHLARLAGGSRILGLDKPTTPEEWLGRLQRLAAVNGLRDGVIKLVRYRDVAGVGELALVRGAPPASAAGWRVRAAAFPRSGSMHAVKSIAYIENILSRRAAQADGYDDVLFSDPAGNILEGSATNVFAVVDGVICTPPADSMLLPGIAREVVLEISGARARLCPLTPDLVAAAQEIFVTNAVVGVVPVVEYAGRCFSAGDNRVCAEVASEFFRLQRESLVG